MQLNKTTSTILINVSEFISDSFGQHFHDYIRTNVEALSMTLQLINDFDLEHMVDVMIWTMWRHSNNDEYDSHLVNFKEFIFFTTANASRHHEGDILSFLKSYYGSNSDDGYDDEVEDEDEGNNLIPDEVYGDVDPEDVSFLNQLLKL